MEPAKIILRYRNGNIVKGYSQDFFPNKQVFHITSGVRATSEKPAEVKTNDLKAIFFVKSFEGRADYKERQEYREGERPSGRRAEVVFEDDETLRGAVLGYNPQQNGFFLFPIDPESNNDRIFIVNASVKNFRFL